MINPLTHIPLCIVGRRPDPDKALIGYDLSDGADRWVDFLAHTTQAIRSTAVLCYVIRSLKLKTTQKYDERYNAANREGAGTIMVGRDGTSVVEEFFIGRVSQKILQLAHDKAVWIIN